MVISFDWISIPWRNLSISKKLYSVFGIMAILILIELITLNFSMTNLSAVRAFVHGEGLWSKAQKTALYQLQRYAFSRDEKDYVLFHDALTIPNGDRLARTELMKAEPNLDVVRQGFLTGGVHPDDIDPMIHLLQRFYWVSYISNAMAAWTEGDRLLLELRSAGIEFHRLISGPEKDDTSLEEISARIQSLNNQLTVAENQFSSILGEGSRWLENLVFLILIGLVITVESIGLTMTFLTSHSISKGLLDLNHAAEEIGLGRFGQKLKVTSKDEIGQLTHSVNRMGELLQKSYGQLSESHAQLEKKIHERTAELEKIARENVILYEQAQTAVKMRDEFLSIASHELRTPLTALDLQLQMLLRSAGSEEIARNPTKPYEMAQKALALSRRLSSLQQVLLDLTRIQLGKLELKKEHCDLVSLVMDSVSQVGGEAALSGSQITIHSPLPIMGDFDPTRLGQVVTNLLVNAIKYGEGKPIDVTTIKEKSVAKILIQDYGKGIEPEKQEIIFNRFERASDAQAGVSLGLGLYISRQIVEAHKGQLSLVESSEKGTIFMVELPI